MNNVEEPQEPMIIKDPQDTTNIELASMFQEPDKEEADSREKGHQKLKKQADNQGYTSAMSLTTSVGIIIGVLLLFILLLIII